MEELELLVDFQQGWSQDIDRYAISVVIMLSRL